MKEEMTSEIAKYNPKLAARSKPLRPQVVSQNSQGVRDKMKSSIQTARNTKSIASPFCGHLP
jgi:sugar-specific transcriptional regulator TrmB